MSQHSERGIKVYCPKIRSWIVESYGGDVRLTGLYDPGGIRRFRGDRRPNDRSRESDDYRQGARPEPFQSSGIERTFRSRSIFPQWSCSHPRGGHQPISSSENSKLQTNAARYGELGGVPKGSLETLCGAWLCLHAVAPHNRTGRKFPVTQRFSKWCRKGVSV